MSYRGRFAPSPSGPLHFGSLIAAMGSYLDARKNQGKWLVRMENIDPPREVAGAADDILRTLESFGFEWDEPVLYQSNRLDAYQAAIDQLQQEDLLYRCFCSRSEIQALGIAGAEGVVYPGTCRTGFSLRDVNSKERYALRLITHDRPVVFNDSIWGAINQRIAREIGDFVIRRADGLFAYQLAVVVDDAYQGITDVVRGADLLKSTPRQIYLQGLLNYPTPNYKHLPLARAPDGRKLSKRLGDDPINSSDQITALLAALEFLNQPIPPERPESVGDLWTWAITEWDSGRIINNLDFTG